MPWRGLLLLAATALGGAPLHAQAPDSLAGGPGEVFVGSETEEYLRYLQIQGDVPLYPWSIRGFSPHEVDRLAPADAPHPWAGRYRLRPDTTPGLHLEVLPPTVQEIYNSAFPYGVNDGPVWAGRGLTTSVQLGASARYGPVSLVLAPMFFRAENEHFDLAENGMEGSLRFADPRMPQSIDLPQRFGDAPLARVDPGQSTLRFDGYGVAAGVSTANQFWGPATRHPIILGNNAGGFAHAFLGTSRPVGVGIGSLHGRLVWGRLDQSDYTVVGPDSAARFMSGIVGVFVPRGFPGLEIGGSRFFHAPWPEQGGLGEEILRPLGGVLKVDTDDPTDREPDGLLVDQLVSVFARWVAPRGGFEVYGEYGREDHSWNLRDLVLEPDHSGGYMLGFRKAWRPSSARFLALRGEVLDTRESHLRRIRYQGRYYQHPNGRGHTQRGQLLGSASGYGGSGAYLAGDFYHPRGRLTVLWSRDLRDDTPPEDVDPGERDVLHGLGGEVLHFVGPFDIAAALRGVSERNRDFGSDVFNLNARLQVRMRI